jgi:hypothetical protein
MGFLEIVRDLLRQSKANVCFLRHLARFACYLRSVFGQFATLSRFFDQQTQ